METAHAHPCPGLVVHPVIPGQNPPSHIPLDGTTNINSASDKMSFAFDQPTAYVCKHNACLPPAKSIEDLTARLNSFLHVAVLNVE